MSQPWSREPTHWMKASRRGGLAVGGPADVALRGAGGREHPLELHVGEHVGGQPVAELAPPRGVEGLEAGREDHGPDFQFERSRPADRSRWRRPGRPSRTGRTRRSEMDAVVAVDDRHARRGLRMGQVDAGPGGEALVEAGDVRRHPPGGDRGQIDGAGGADERAGPAGLALLALLVVGRAHLARFAAAEEVDRPAAHHLVADPRAQAAEDALPFGRLAERGGGRRPAPRRIRPARASPAPGPAAIPGRPAGPPSRCAVSVWTTRLVSTGWLHEATSWPPRGVSISTRHTRHAP